MIVSKSFGRSFRGVLDYVIHGPADGSANKRAVVIGSNMAGQTPRELAAEFGALRKLRPNLGKAVAHFSLSLPPSERDMSDAGFANIALRFLDGMGFTDTPYLIARHHDTEHQHIHIIASRVRTDGGVVSDKNDFRRAESLAREIEMEFELIPLDPEPATPTPQQTGDDAMEFLTERQQKRAQRKAEEEARRWTAGFGDGEPLPTNKDRELRRDAFEPQWADTLDQLFRLEIRKIERKNFGLDLRFRDGGTIKDFGNRVEADGMDEEQAARRLVEMCDAKGWHKVHFFGSEAFVRAAMAEALARGIAIEPQTVDQALILTELMAVAGGGAANAGGSPVRPNINGVPAHLQPRGQQPPPAPANPTPQQAPTPPSPPRGPRA